MELSELMKWNQIDGLDGMNKTVGMFQWNWNRKYSTDLNGWTKGMEIIEKMVSIKLIEVMEPMELNV